jgi:molybdopterin converting factor small subunit
MKDSAAVTVEFYGIPRQRAGRSELVVNAASLQEVLAAVQEACPNLPKLLNAQGILGSHYLLSLNGEQFISDPTYSMQSGDRLLLLSADAGG